jgi:hypothetical protein
MGVDSARHGSAAPAEDGRGLDGYLSAITDLLVARVDKPEQKCDRGHACEATIGSFSKMVGALVLARATATADPAPSDEVISSTHRRLRRPQQRRSRLGRGEHSSSANLDLHRAFPPKRRETSPSPAWRRRSRVPSVSNSLADANSGQERKPEEGSARQHSSMPLCQIPRLQCANTASIRRVVSALPALNNA